MFLTESWLLWLVCVELILSVRPYRIKFLLLKSGHSLRSHTVYTKSHSRSVGWVRVRVRAEMEEIRPPSTLRGYEGVIPPVQ